MAAPADVQRRNTAPVHSIEEQLVEQVNNLTRSLRLLVQKIDGDADADDDYEASITDELIATAPRIIVPTP